MRQDLAAIGQPARPAGSSVQAHASFTWRHLATALLLLMVVPVLFVAGAAALAILPLALAVVGIDQALDYSRSLREPQPARLHH